MRGRSEGPKGKVEAGYRPRELGPSSQAFIRVLVSSAGLVNSKSKVLLSPMGLTHTEKAVGERAIGNIISGTHICCDSVGCYLEHVLACGASYRLKASPGQLKHNGCRGGKTME